MFFGFKSLHHLSYITFNIPILCNYYNCSTVYIAHGTKIHSGKASQSGSLKENCDIVERPVGNSLFVKHLHYEYLLLPKFLGQTDPVPRLKKMYIKKNETLKMQRTNQLYHEDQKASVSYMGKRGYFFKKCKWKIN